MDGIAGAPPPFLARRIASEIFSAIEVGLEWHDTGSCPASPDVIKIGFPAEAPKGVSVEALAYALPYEAPTSPELWFSRLKM
jgi:hypothetical protein